MAIRNASSGEPRTAQSGAYSDVSASGEASGADVRRRSRNETAAAELTIEEVILTRDWVRLRMPQTLVGFDVVPIGAVGQVVKVGPTGALVRFRGKYPPTSVNLTNIEEGQAGRHRSERERAPLPRVLAQRAVAADLPTSLRQGHDHARELAEVGAALPDRSR